MPILNFKEIPAANAGPDRDLFELFAREFLHCKGFEITSGPDRGADGGKDMIALEHREGPGGRTEVRWLVSCKHNAHSGKSVSEKDELNLRDRIEKHECAGFIAFYSTLPSSGLSNNLQVLKKRFHILVFDSESIERELLEGQDGHILASRFMPLSAKDLPTTTQHTSKHYPSEVHLSKSQFFIKQPHENLDEAKEDAQKRNVPIFVVVYDAEHPTHSKLAYSLGYFMEYQITKRLVDDHFVVALGPSSNPQFGALVPENDPLENCLWVVLSPAGTFLRREGVYANADEGMKRVREVVKAHS